MLLDQLNPRARTLASYYEPSQVSSDALMQAQSSAQLGAQSGSLGASTTLAGGTGGSYSFDVNEIKGFQPQPYYGNGADSMAGSGNPMGYDAYKKFKGTDGTDLVAEIIPTSRRTLMEGDNFGQGAQYQDVADYNTPQGYLVYKNTDFGGGWLGGEHYSRLNGVKYDDYSADGTLRKSGVFQGMTDDFLGPWSALAVMAMAAGGAAAGFGGAAAEGAAAGAGAAEGAAAGAAGAETASAGFGSAFEASVAGGGAGTGAGVGAGVLDLGGGLTMSADGVIGGATGISGGTMSTAAIDSIISGASVEGAGAIGSVGAVAGGGGSVTPGVFNPAVDSQLANAQLGITGNQAAFDAAVTTTPSVTVNGAPGGSFFDDFMSNKLAQTLGTKALEMGLGAVGSSLLAPGGDTGATTAPPTVPKPLPMPDPLATLDMKRTSVRNQRARHGRLSTILTTPRH